MSSLTFAYYCSGHGYGHATRVSAFATHLACMKQAPKIHIVSSAPKHVFSQALDNGAYYRYAEIDPVIVQPLAYHVDRRKSVDVLKKFLSQQEQKVDEEAAWLRENRVDCVLSDAAFLACKAANAAHIPSVLITNFTFDSVYSYLSIEFPKGSPLLLEHQSPKIFALNDEPISPEELRGLVGELYDGYRCAELLIRLPGNIPIPSFSLSPSLPSHFWTNPQENVFYPEILSSLSRDISIDPLHPSVPFPITSKKKKAIPRKIMQSPLIVRHPSPDIYTPTGRKRILDYIGVPGNLQGADRKILIVSFGGQVFRKPSSRATTRSHSRATTPTESGQHSPCFSAVKLPRTSSTESNNSNEPSVQSKHLTPPRCTGLQNCDTETHGFVKVSQPIATPSHLWIPGAPPANKARTTSVLPSSELPSSSTGGTLKQSRGEISEENSYHSTFPDAQPSPKELDLGSQELDIPVPSDLESESSDFEPHLLPDDSWIAVVCGATAAPKTADSSASDDEMPENFFVAPRDVYMPDLTAVGDVLLGKLGYGTVSECVDSCTPFLYVPRPLFIEEHGLRHLLNDEGVGVELSREQYESGSWAASIQEAWMHGQRRKAWKREVGENGQRRKEGERIANELVDWVWEWRQFEWEEGSEGR